MEILEKFCISCKAPDARLELSAECLKYDGKYIRFVAMDVYSNHFSNHSLTNMGRVVRIWAESFRRRSSQI